MKKQKDSFIESIISLVFSQGIIKIFGLLYSMYLINKSGFGDKGNAIYMGGYQIYLLLLTISSIGVPNAVAKLVAEKIALDDYKGANMIFKVAVISFSIIGFFGTLSLFFLAKSIANCFLLIPETEYSLIALSPSIFFVSISSVIRGYFNGISKISQTAKSQAIEQILKAILTIFFVEIISIYYKNTIIMASVANFASTCSIFINFIYLFICYLNLKKYQNIEQIRFSTQKKERTINILKKILVVSIPITISAILGSLSKIIDSFTIVRILTPLLGENIAKLKYGILSSKVDMLTVMPLSFNIALSTVLVPNISSALASNNINSLNRKISFSLLITALISIPSAIGLSLYSKQILNLLFPNANSGFELLKISSFCIIFMAFNQTISGALHGIGKTNSTVFALFIGVIIKLLLNIFLLPISNLYEKGAIIANLISNMVIFVIEWNILKNTIKMDFNLYSVIFKPLVASILMGMASYVFYIYLSNILLNDKLIIIMTILFAILIYLFLIVFFKIFEKDDLKKLPNGKNIYDILKKF